MIELKFKVIDAFEGDNIIGGIIQRLPAYLTLYTPNIASKFHILLDSPTIKKTQEVSGQTQPGSKYHWRIPITEEQGDWRLSVLMEGEKKQKKKTSIKKVIKFTITPELFDYTFEEGEDENEYLAELSRSIPTSNEIKCIDVTSRLVEIDAHWLEIDSKLNISRYIYQDTKTKIKQRFVPILLVHGFYSDFTTWNYLVRLLWDDGFRHIFAINEYDDRLGVKTNAERIEEAIDEILTISNHTSLIFIGHSLGGLIGRYFVKKVNPSKIQLLISAAAPHLCGLNRLWGKIFILLKNAKMTELDVTLHPSSSLTEIRDTVNEADFYQQTMINICGTRLRGGDGGFKLKDNLVPDMCNIGVNTIHMSVNKNEEFYKIIHEAIFGKSVFYKIRMLYINPTSTIKKTPKIHLMIKPQDNENRLQRFPVKGYFELGEKEPYIPEAPMIAYVNSCPSKKKVERLVIQVKNEKNRLLAEEVFFIPLGLKKDISDHFIIDTNVGYSIQFVSYSYKLKYT